MYDFSYFKGGLAAVIYTDTFQTGIMLIGGIILTTMGKYDQLVLNK